MRGVRRIVLAAWAITVAACATQPPFITVAPEPKNYAWWLRSDIRPFGGSVRGVPVSQLNGDWCKANEFTLELFPPEVRSTGDMPLEQALKESGAAFSLVNIFGNGQSVDVLVGVYQTCANERGTFLMAFDPAKRVSLHVVEFAGKANFAVLHREEHNRLSLWWCFACDNVSTFKWNSAAGRFEHEQEPEDEDDMAPNSSLQPTPASGRG